MALCTDFGFFLSVVQEDDICNCEMGTCDCNKETQRSFCVCVEGFEGTVNFLVGDHPWCTTKWSLTGGGRLREKSTK